MSDEDGQLTLVGFKTPILQWQHSLIAKEHCPSYWIWSFFYDRQWFFKAFRAPFSKGEICAYKTLQKVFRLAPCESLWPANRFKP